MAVGRRSAAPEQLAQACSIRPIAPPTTIAGVDVGEDFLDLAVTTGARIEFFRVALLGLQTNLIAQLAQRLREACPGLGPETLCAIDSPRWPIDLDAARRKTVARRDTPKSRRLDRTLRDILRQRKPPLALSLFPTPPHAYFANCAAVCRKLHLRAAFLELFDGGAPVQSTAPHGLFTRFMLAGFATYRALETLGARAVEAYPDLQYRLWSEPPLIPKRRRQAALDDRRARLLRIRTQLGIGATPVAATLDQADAEIIATTCLLAARRNCLALLEHAEEGSFLLAGYPQAGAIKPYLRPGYSS